MGERLKAMQDPQGKSMGHCDCRYPSPDKTGTLHPSAMAGFFYRLSRAGNTQDSHD